MVSEVEKETAAEYINKGRPVYFSYARNSNKNPEWTHISDCVDVLLKEFDKHNIEYRVDKRDIGAGDKISDFEREIGGKSEVVVIVFSDKYFRSLHCMYEFVQIKKSLADNPSKRLLCIKSGDFNLADIRYILELERYWGDQRQDYEEIEYHRLRNHSGTEIAAFENGFYMDEVRNLYSFFSAINYSYATNDDWSGFIKDIKKYYTKPAVSQPLQSKPQPQAVQQSVQRPNSQPNQQPVAQLISHPQPNRQQFQTTAVQPAKTPFLKKVLYGVVGFIVFCIVIGECNTGESDDTSSHSTKFVSTVENSEVISDYERPQQTDVDYLYIYRVKITNKSTIVFCRYTNIYEEDVKFAIPIVSDATYLRAGSKILNLTDVSSLDEGVPVLEPGACAEFVLYFPPLPNSVQEFVFILEDGTKKEVILR
ncbi:MAG: toll/interleukin-1 receptor domain-containing protein [Bacteroidales bacterium]|nr:toll/interleukin-1 receptor domain-containing protein [Bacteroidales bacterium]